MEFIKQSLNFVSQSSKEEKEVEETDRTSTQKEVSSASLCVGDIDTAGSERKQPNDEEEGIEEIQPSQGPPHASRRESDGLNGLKTRPPEAPSSSLPPSYDGKDSTNDDNEISEEEEQDGIGNDGDDPKQAVDRRTSKGLYTSNIRFVDHFSLSAPASRVKFSNASTQVYEQRNSQFLIEDREDTSYVEARKAKNGSIGLLGLRLWYTIVAFFMVGFLFIFCLMLLLFLFLELTSSAGLVSTVEFNGLDFVAVLFSIPLWVYSLGSAMAIGAAYVADTWGGNSFFHIIAGWTDVKMQWVTFWAFLGIPIVVAIISLFVKSNIWWTITATVWFSCVFAMYCFFALFVVLFELLGSMAMIKRADKYDNIDDSMPAWKLIWTIIMHRQRERFSGNIQHQFIEYSTEDPPKDNNYVQEGREAEKVVRNLWCRFTQISLLQKLNWFIDVTDEKKQIYSIDEITGRTPIITDKTWALEKLYCRPTGSRIIVVVNGKNTITDSQIYSSYACALIGNILIVLGLTSFLVWLQTGAVVIVFCVILVVLFLVPKMIQSYRFFKLIKKTADLKKNDDELECDEILYQVWERHRVTKPSNATCLVIFLIEIIIFYLWPMIHLFVIGNNAISSLFLVAGFISLVRHYFNAPSILREIGTLNVLDKEVDKRRWSRLSQRLILLGDYQEKARLSLIISKISAGPRRNLWMWLFAIVVTIFCMLYLSAYSGGTAEGNPPDADYLSPSEFQYEPPDALPYPTCRMGNGLSIPGSPETALADYSYLSSIAYVKPGDATQAALDLWFGEGVAKDHQDLVDSYRAGDLTDEKPGQTAAVYKLTSFPGSNVASLRGEDNTGDFAVVSIRGTISKWDALADAQLWATAAMFQFLRAVLPIGELWTPILDICVKAVSVLETTALEKVSYYKATSNFVNFLKSSTNFTEIRVTGHSLGGGLAMITGSQTNSSSIALSGPNTKLSRRTFIPPISMGQLDALTFNIIPDRDPVPRLDDRAELFQQIHCTAPTNNPVDCHTSTRSLCEILVKCGNIPSSSFAPTRPVFCYCHKVFGYPKPKQIGNRTFDEACSPSLRIGTQLGDV